MQMIGVGLPLVEGKTSWPRGSMFHYDGNPPMLIISFDNPTQKEIALFDRNPVDLALYEKPPVLYLIHRIAGIESWSDSPYSIHVMEDHCVDLTEVIPSGVGLMFNVVLINSNNGLVVAMHPFSTSTAFSRKLHSAIVRQSLQPFSFSEFQKAVSDIRKTYTTEELLRRADVRYRSGDRN